MRKEPKILLANHHGYENHGLIHFYNHNLWRIYYAPGCLLGPESTKYLRGPAFEEPTPTAEPWVFGTYHSHCFNLVQCL